MIYKITADNFKIADKTQGYIERQAKKLDRYLPDFSVDSVLLEIVIKHHETRGFFEGAITLRLPKHPLTAHFRSQSVDQAMKFGFGKIRKELRNFKGKHFPGDSEYPKRDVFV